MDQMTSYKTALFEAARRLLALAGVEHGEIRVIVHQGTVNDIVMSKRYRDEAKKIQN